MAPIKGIIFDLDGTIANTLPLCIHAFRLSIEPLAMKSLSDEEIIATFGPSEEGTIRALVPDHFEKGVADYLRFYESAHDRCPDPFPGVPELLGLLKEKGIRIAMVTGKGEYSTAISLKKFNLDNTFQPVETGSPMGAVKAEKIQKVLDEWKDLDKAAVIYVGDAPSDITASRKAGISVIGAAWAETAEGEKLLAAQPDKIFYTISAFSDWLLSVI